MEINREEYRKLRYWARVGKGICTDCGNQKAAQGVKVCHSCQIKRSEAYYRKKDGYVREDHPDCSVDFRTVYTGLGTVSEVEK